MPNSQRWKQGLVAACLISFVAWLTAFNGTKARILVVHSRSATSTWVQAVDAGMKKALAGNRRPVNVTWMYLGLETPASQARRPQNRAALQRMLSQFGPQLVIAVDDEANALMGETALRGQTSRVLYLSLDRPPQHYGYGRSPRVSGISERLPLAAIKDLAILLTSQGRPSVAVIGIDTPTGQAEMAQVRQFDWGGVELSSSALVRSADNWRSVVRSTTSDLLLVLSTSALPEPNGRLTSAAELIRWTQTHARALPIGTQIDFVPSGGALSIAPPPELYGQQAIVDALDWLDQRRSPGAPAARTNAHFQVGLREGGLAARGVQLPAIYSEAARAVGALYP